MDWGGCCFSTYPDSNQVQITSTLFRAGLAGGELRPDGDEVRDLAWFDLDRLPEMVGRHRLLVEYAAGLNRPRSGRAVGAGLKLARLRPARPNAPNDSGTATVLGY